MSTVTFSVKPGCTNIAEHQIILTDNNPVRCKSYPVPHALRECMKDEVEKMLELDIIEKSDSPYSSPLLMVRKKDGTNRPVVDYRRINRITVFDAKRMPVAEDIYACLAKAKYFSKMDFVKGYWQIPMTEGDKQKTAFSTPFGLYRFKHMPFGLQNVGATYGRMMRKVLHGLQATDNFVNDVLSFTSEWDNHLAELMRVFVRVRSAGLTVKPSKCYFGYPEVEFLGHLVGNGQLTTTADKTERVANASRPQTKRQLRAFLGLTGYYRRFVPDYATMTAPLTDLTKSKFPNKLSWGPEQESAFNSLKEVLCSDPVLRLPDGDREFILRTDASDVGVGAVLLQSHPDGVFLVAYLSRKLTRAERNYAVIKRECLAIVWAIGKLQTYLYGRSFVLQTDHRPLVYMDKSKMANARVMRWALALQPF